jgi:hypothetical protein
VYAAPRVQLQAGADAFQASFPQIQLNAGLPTAELATATDAKDPFHLQLDPQAGGLIEVWWDGMHANRTDNLIPEGQLPKLWPLVAFIKLDDETLADNKTTDHSNDPESLNAQGFDLKKPAVVIQGITLEKDSVFQTLSDTLVNRLPVQPNANTGYDHITVLVRPSVLCVDPRHPEKGGLLVTPHTKGPQADHPNVDPSQYVDLFDQATVLAAQKDLVNGFQLGCLPKGRYAINAIYPSGQAWTVPNEMGSCAKAEGASSFAPGVGDCSIQHRPTLFSQGNRNVIEIVDPVDPTYCNANPSPAACTQPY